MKRKRGANLEPLLEIFRNSEYRYSVNGIAVSCGNSKASQKTVVQRARPPEFSALHARPIFVKRKKPSSDP